MLSAAVLYGLLYLILSLEDYALLAGVLLGFAALRIDWSGSAGRAAPISTPASL